MNELHSGEKQLKTSVSNAKLYKGRNAYIRAMNRVDLMSAGTHQRQKTHEIGSKAGSYIINKRNRQLSMNSNGNQDNFNRSAQSYYKNHRNSFIKQPNFMTQMNPMESGYGEFLVNESKTFSFQ